MKSLGALVPETLIQHQPDPWIWLYRILLEQTTIASTYAQITPYDAEVVFAGKTYYPFPVAHQPIQEASEGDLPQLEVQLSNVRRDFTRYLETGKGGVGNTVELYLVHAAQLASGDSWSFEGEIRGAVATDQVVTLQVQVPYWYQIPSPKDQYTRNRCRWRYKSFECGYRGAIAACDKTLDGTNGCIVHGQDEQANNMPILHPRFFGGFPALPRSVR